MKNYTTFLGKFITKIIFNSKHFNYNIHFLNIVSVRWRPLLSTHSPKRFWKFCITRCSMLGEIAATSSLLFCFKSTVVLWFLFVHLALEISSEEELLWLGTLVPMNIEVPTKYPLSQVRIVVFWNTSPQQKPDALQTSAPWQMKCFESR